MSLIKLLSFPLIALRGLLAMGGQDSKLERLEEREWRRRIILASRRVQHVHLSMEAELAQMREQKEQGFHGPQTVLELAEVLSASKELLHGFRKSCAAHEAVLKEQIDRLQQTSGLRTPAGGLAEVDHNFNELAQAAVASSAVRQAASAPEALEPLGDDSSEFNLDGSHAASVEGARDLSGPPPEVVGPVHALQLAEETAPEAARSTGAIIQAQEPYPVLALEAVDQAAQETCEAQLAQPVAGDESKALVKPLQRDGSKLKRPDAGGAEDAEEPIDAPETRTDELDEVIAYLDIEIEGSQLSSTVDGIDDDTLKLDLVLRAAAPHDDSMQMNFDSIQPETSGQEEQSSDAEAHKGCDGSDSSGATQDRASSLEHQASSRIAELSDALEQERRLGLERDRQAELEQRLAQERIAELEHELCAQGLQRSLDEELSAELGETTQRLGEQIEDLQGLVLSMDLKGDHSDHQSSAEQLAESMARMLELEGVNQELQAKLDSIAPVAAQTLELEAVREQLRQSEMMRVAQDAKHTEELTEFADHMHVRLSAVEKQLATSRLAWTDMSQERDKIAALAFTSERVLASLKIDHEKLKAENQTLAATYKSLGAIQSLLRRNSDAAAPETTTLSKLMGSGAGQRIDLIQAREAEPSKLLVENDSGERDSGVA